RAGGAAWAGGEAIARARKTNAETRRACTMQREAAGGMARGMALKPRGKEARVFFITLSRRWWRGVLLGLLIVGGGWLALTLEREGGVQRGGVAPLPEETLQDAWPAAAFPALAPSPAVPAAPTAGLPSVQVTGGRA